MDVIFHQCSVGFNVPHGTFDGSNKHGFIAVLDNAYFLHSLVRCRGADQISVGHFLFYVVLNEVYFYIFSYLGSPISRL